MQSALSCYPDEVIEDPYLWMMLLYKQFHLMPLRRLVSGFSGARQPNTTDKPIATRICVLISQAFDVIVNVVGPYGPIIRSPYHVLVQVALVPHPRVDLEEQTPVV